MSEHVVKELSIHDDALIANVSVGNWAMLLMSALNKRLSRVTVFYKSKRLQLSLYRRSV